MIANVFIIKKDVSGYYRIVYKNTTSDSLGEDLIFIMTFPFRSDESITNFLKNNWEDLSMELYRLKRINEREVFIEFFNFDLDILHIIKIEKQKLLNIVNQWNDVVLKQPSEIIAIQKNKEIEFTGVFPLGECPIKPYLLLRKSKNSDYKYYDQMPPFSYRRISPYNNKTFEFIYIILQHLDINEFNIFKSIINFINEGSTNEFFSKYFKLKVTSEIIFFTEINPNSLTAPLQFILNKKHFTQLLADLDEAITTNGQEIIISQNNEGSYKVETTYETVEAFPKYRCYP